MPQMDAERGVDHLIQRDLVESANGGLLLVERFGVVPGGDLGFDLRDVRPSVRRQIAAGANEPVGRVDAVGAVIRSMVDMPSAPCQGRTGLGRL
jgi:hypothetical protein